MESLPPLVKIFNELDKNKDNRVTKAEYMSELMKLHPSQVDEVRLRKAFKAIDQDGSGKIDVKELKQVMVNAGKTVDDQTLQDIIKSCDTDGDGEINIEEFIAAFRS